MRRIKTNIVGLCFVLSLGSYCGYCLRPFVGKPPIEFGEFIGDADKAVLTEWYQNSSRVPGLKFDWQEFKYALRHPLAPGRFAALATCGGLGGEGTVMVSFTGYIAIFRTGEHGLEFEKEERAN